MSIQEKKIHERMAIWREAMDLTEKTFRATESLPADERLLLGSAMRQAALAVPTAIAAGAAMASARDYQEQIRRALGALGQLQTLCLVVKRLGYQEAEVLAQLMGGGEKLSRRLDQHLQVLVGPEQRAA